ncbi:hypothetical protein ACWX0K_11015 [Nitrobacteraceae bacterium UC4446_H13]
MTVASEFCGPTDLRWTGAETSFAAGFVAETAEAVKVSYLPDATSVRVDLTLGIHFSVAGAGSGSVTVIPLALPAAPGNIRILRSTPATQEVAFENLRKFDNAIHTRLHDRAAMRDAELMMRLGAAADALENAQHLQDLSNHVDIVSTEVEADKETAEAARDVAVAAAGTNLVNFPTRDIAALATIPAVIKYVQVAGTVESGDGGDAIYVRVTSEPAFEGGKFRSQDRFLPDGSTSAGDGGWWLFKSSDPRVAHFGAIRTLDDRAVWQTAISSLSAGDTLAFPAGIKGTIVNGDGGGEANPQAARWVAVNGDGYLAALTSDTDDVRVVINGQIDFTSFVDDGFRFTGDRVKFIAERGGKVTNTSGVFVADNSSDPTVQWRPSLIRLDGDDCEIAGLHFLNHPTIAAWLRGSRGKVHHNLFEGGPTEHAVGEYTVQFFVALAPESGGGVGGDVSYNTFRRSAAGGAAYTAIFGVQPGALFGFNKIYDMLEHGIYNYGTGVTMIGNHVDDTIGTMQAAALQNFAPGCILKANQLTGNNNVIALQEASDCLVELNRGGGVTVRKYHATGTSALVENLILSQNILVAPPGQFWPIDIGLDQPFKKISLLGNIVSGGGDSFANQRGAISVVVTDTAGDGGQELLAQGNVVDGGASYSLLARRISSGLITGNNFKDAWIGGGGDTAARLFNCDGLKFGWNHVRDSRETPVLSRILYAPTADGNSNLEGNFNNISRPKAAANAFMTLPDDARPEGNTQDALPLTGTFTMPNVDAQNFNHTAVRAGAKIRLYPRNKEAWDLQASAYHIDVSAISNGVFQVATANGAAATPTGGVFDYEILQ